ncbi:hypothetical protein ACFORO_10440 [Amycolatopsis halotolerans]|uniref:Uncharacterized protein n=1 Tax=Amycolatopsis halotolerans TaxID=330083 RepID=A0ABV7QEY9_9PSEU
MPLCTATSKRSGKPCGRLAMVGQAVCATHGGSAPQAKRKAVERQTEAQARVELGKLTALLGPAEAVEDPLGELLQLAGEAKRWKELLAGRVSQLTALGYEGVMGEQVRHEVQLLEKATDRMAAILTAIAKLRIDERLVEVHGKIGERQAEMLAAMAFAVLDWLGLQHEHYQQARKIMAAVMQAELNGEPKPRLPERPDLYKVVERVEYRDVEVEKPCPKCNQPAQPVVIEQPRELPPSRPRRQIEPYRPLNADGSVPGWENWA